MGFDMNYKIKVANEVESKEAQELFFELGYGWRGVTPKNSIFIPKKLKEYFIINYENTKDMQLSGIFDNSETLTAHKEITLPELRDLVVLKRNDVGDATHTDQDNWKWYVGADAYVWQAGNAQQLKQWDKSGLYMVDLKPIEKKEMKDYLEKQPNGSYVMKSGFALAPADWIEIPDGATYYAEDANLGKKEIFFFRLRSNDFKDEAVWLESNWMRACFNVENQKVLWRRESPNDKLASAEQYRQAEVLPFIDDDFAESDAWIESNIEQGSIEQTLAQRQSQYGCFEDVAFVTQSMIELMRKCNYDKMPAPHQMALSMICSKMARIVNGDFNHKDSWHDIGGYAKLIEDEIFDETEMPF